jgi:hypothetical protein
MHHGCVAGANGGEEAAGRVVADVANDHGMTAEQAKQGLMASDLGFLAPLAGLEPATCCLGDG